MAGLRERQKADRDRRILYAAVTRFRASGYRAVRIEDLAEAAGVSVGTVYNYYRNKGDILIATVAMEVEEVLGTGEAVVAAPPRGVEAAIRALIFGYYDHSLEYLSKEMWRNAMALSIEAPETPNGRRYTDLDRRLEDQVVRLIRRLSERGDVRPGLDTEAVGHVLFNTLNMEFIEFVKDEAMTLAALRARVEAQIRAVARLIARKEDA